MQRLSEVFLLDDPLTVRLHSVYLMALKDLTRVLQESNIRVTIINSAKDIHNNAIVFVGDQFNCANPAEDITKYAPDALYCLWYWHNTPSSIIKNAIHLHENCIDWHKYDLIVKLKTLPVSSPLPWFSPEPPSKIGTYKRNIVRDYFFSGYNYRREWVPDSSSGLVGLYHGTYDTWNYLSYEARREMHLSSHFALGFHSDLTIDYKSVSHRVFEGISLGAIVLTDSDPAVSQTDGIAIRVYSKEHLVETMKTLLANPNEMECRRQLGYRFIKRRGTSCNSIGSILNIASKVVGCDRDEILNGFPESIFIDKQN